MLTARQKECLDMIAGRIRETGGIPPTVREVQAALHLGSAHGAKTLIDQLVARGRIRRVPRCARAIEVIPERHPRGAIARVSYPDAQFFLWDDEAKALKPMERKA